MLYLPPKGSPWDEDPLSRNADGSQRYLLSQKAVYGDSKSNKMWFNLLSSVLHDYGFIPVDAPGCVLVLHTSKGIIIITLIVDDLLNGFSCQVMYNEYLKYINLFKIDEGPFGKYDGLEINYNREQGTMTMTITQEAYIERMAGRVGIDKETLSLMSTLLLQQSTEPLTEIALLW